MNPVKMYRNLKLVKEMCKTLQSPMNGNKQWRKHKLRQSWKEKTQKDNRDTETRITNRIKEVEDTHSFIEDTVEEIPGKETVKS